jgi:hypothetical protein
MTLAMRQLLSRQTFEQKIQKVAALIALAKKVRPPRPANLPAPGDSGSVAPHTFR